MTSSYLLFRIANRLFGVKLQGAIEILAWRRSRPVPFAYSYIEGIMEYRGIVYPVIRLAQLLEISRMRPIGFTAIEVNDTPKGQSIILLQEGDKPFGITIDEFVRMAKLEDPTDVPADIKGINAKLVKGTRLEDDQEIIILGFERLFHAS